MKMKILGLAGLLVAATAVVAQDSGESTAKESGAGANVMVTITIGEVKAGPQRTYKIISRSGEESEMLVGWRTPIPTLRSGDGEGGEPVTSYIYQNVGMTVVFRPLLLRDGRLRLQGQIELSGSKQSEVSETPDGMPIIGTFQQKLDVLLETGKPLRVAEVPDPEGGQRFLEIEARLLD